MEDRTYSPRRAFVDQYYLDEADGEVRPLEAYLSMFPGDLTGIALEYQKLVDGRGLLPAAPTSGPSAQGTTASECAANDRIGKYVVLRRLGKGTQGIVYLAEDTGLHRLVALKVLLGAGLPDQEEQQRRFDRERTALAMLDHPAICALYDAGQDKGKDFIAMRYVKGRPLDDFVKDRRKSLGMGGRDGSESPGTAPAPRRSDRGQGARDCFSDLPVTLSFFEAAAKAIHAAHTLRIVHRDLKPNNIMVTTENLPVILDFGLAALKDGSISNSTVSGTILGTPLYMAPEQIRGEAHTHDARTDIYNLAATLYECLTLRPPFQAENLHALYDQIVNRAPVSARRLNRSVSRELAAVIEVAMAKEPRDRYPTAYALGEDLRRVRENRPIEARQAGVLRKVALQVRRRPLVMALAGVIAILLVGGVVWTQVKNSELASRTMEAEKNAAIAAENAREAALRADELLESGRREEAAREAKRASEALRALETARTLREAGDPTEALSWLGRARELGHRPELDIEIEEIMAQEATQAVDEARARAIQLLERGAPQSSRVTLLAGRLLRNQPDQQARVRDLLGAALLDEGLDRADRAFANAILADEPRAAKAHLEDCVRANPRHRAGNVELAQMLLSLGDFPACERHMAGLKALYGSDPEFAIIELTCLALQGRKDLVEHRIETLQVRMNPRDLERIRAAVDVIESLPEIERTLCASLIDAAPSGTVKLLRGVGTINELLSAGRPTMPLSARLGGLPDDLQDLMKALAPLTIRLLFLNLKDPAAVRDVAKTLDPIIERLSWGVLRAVRGGLLCLAEDYEEAQADIRFALENPGPIPMPRYASMLLVVNYICVFGHHKGAVPEPERFLPTVRRALTFLESVADLSPAELRLAIQGAASAGEYERCLRFYSVFKRLVDKDPLVERLVGTAHYRRGAYGPAMIAFKRALQADPTFSLARSQLEQCRGLLGLVGPPAAPQQISDFLRDLPPPPPSRDEK